jgi:hypothetical protein
VSNNRPQRSPDGRWWWDGNAWRAIPESGGRRRALAIVFIVLLTGGTIAAVLLLRGGPTATQDLTVTGSRFAHFTTGRVQNCERAQADPDRNSTVFKFNVKLPAEKPTLQLVVDVFRYKGPGSYLSDASQTDTSAIAGPPGFNNPTDISLDAHVVVDPSESSGSIEADFVDYQRQPTYHLSGTWHCR